MSPDRERERKREQSLPRSLSLPLSRLSFCGHECLELSLSLSINRYSKTTNTQACSHGLLTLSLGMVAAPPAPAPPALAEPSFCWGPLLPSKLIII